MKKERIAGVEKVNAPVNLIHRNRGRSTRTDNGHWMRWFLAACLTFSSGEALRIHAGVIRVSANQTNNVPDGGSWTTAFPLVQQGIAVATTGDAVWVAAGTYFENVSLKAAVEL